jgi:hypothetical protein
VEIGQITRSHCNLALELAEPAVDRAPRAKKKAAGRG